MSEFVPLNQAHAWDEESDVRVNFLPFADRVPDFLPKERLLIDVGTIGEICRLTRVSSLLVTGQYQETRMEPVGGEEGRGTIAVTQGMVLRPEPSRSGRGRFPMDPLAAAFLHGANFTDEQFILNLRKLLDSKDFNPRDLEKWASFIDEGVKAALWKTAWAKLGNFSKERLLADMLSPLLAVVLVYPDELRSLIRTVFVMVTAIAACSEPELWGLAYLLSMRVGQDFDCLMLKRLADDFNLKIKYDPPISLTVGQFEYDRLLSIGIRLGTNKLVKVAADVPKGEAVKSPE